MILQNVRNTIDHFCVLRRWNSYTPKLPGTGGLGGGYFLRWNNKGIVIDPGFNFLENLDSCGYGLRDIDAIFLTHGHIDHTDSFESLLMMLERRKRLRVRANTVRVFISDGCEARFGNYLRQLACLDTKIIEPPYKYQWDGKWKRIDEISEWGIKVLPLQTYHEEVIPQGESRGVGLRFDLYKNDKLIHRIGLTSDTKFYQEDGEHTYLELNIEKLKPCDIVICHIGDISLGELLSLLQIELPTTKADDLRKTLVQINDAIKEGNLWRQMEMLGLPSEPENFMSSMYALITKEPNPKYMSKNHMGFYGLFQLISALKADSEMKLGILSEFGEELGSFRHRIARTISNSLQLDKCKMKILTGDIGLSVQLLDNFKQCPACHTTTKLLIQCSTCGRSVCPVCIKETCIKHKQKSIIYNCPREKCLSQEFAPPIAKLPREKLSGF